MKPFSDLLGAADRLLLLLDFDGTLAPIVTEPEEAHLPERTRAALEKLASNGRDHVAILSGRRLDDLRDRVGLPDLIYSGNHGSEIAGPGFERIHPDAERVRPLVRSLAGELRLRLNGIEGVIVEGKDLSISVHYRKSPANCVEAIARIVADAVRSCPELILSEGRKVFELRPRGGWNKGEAASWIRQRTGGFPVAIGDDRTDEDIFAAMQDGVTIHSGLLPDTRAQYRLDGPATVGEFLEWLSEVR